jgi:hypothetical protein
MGCFGTLTTTTSFFDNNNNKIGSICIFLVHSWVFDLSLVSYSTIPKNISYGEHEEQLQRPGQQPQQPSQLTIRAAHRQPEPADAGSAANSLASAA